MQIVYPSSVALACSDDSSTTTPMPDSVKAESHIDTLVEDFKVREPVISQSTQKQPTKGINGVNRPFFVAFLTIFLAELGDKTQLATLLISAESQSPWVVFIGAASALVLTSLIGVLLGQWLASRLAPGLLQTATGASLLFISVLLLWDMVHLL